MLTPTASVLSRFSFLNKRTKRSAAQVLFWVVSIVLFSVSLSLLFYLYLSITVLARQTLIYGVYYFYTQGVGGSKKSVFLYNRCVVPFLANRCFRSYWLLNAYRVLPSNFQPLNQKFCSQIFRSGSMLTNACTCTHACPQNKIKYQKNNYAQQSLDGRVNFQIKWLFCSLLLDIAGFFKSPLFPSFFLSRSRLSLSPILQLYRTYNQLDNELLDSDVGWMPLDLSDRR